MKTRLLFTIPASGLPEGTPPPPVPTVITEGEGIALFSTGVSRQLDYCSLEEITTQSIREALHLDPDTFVYLSFIRETPQGMDIYSWDFTVWRQQWWAETLCEVVKQGLVPVKARELVAAL